MTPIFLIGASRRSKAFPLGCHVSLSGRPDGPAAQVTCLYPAAWRPTTPLSRGPQPVYLGRPGGSYGRCAPSQSRWAPVLCGHVLVRLLRCEELSPVRRTRQVLGRPDGREPLR